MASKKGLKELQKQRRGATTKRPIRPPRPFDEDLFSDGCGEGGEEEEIIIANLSDLNWRCRGEQPPLDKQATLTSPSNQFTNFEREMRLHKRSMSRSTMRSNFESGMEIYDSRPTSSSSCYSDKGTQSQETRLEWLHRMGCTVHFPLIPEHHAYESNCKTTSGNTGCRCFSKMPETRYVTVLQPGISVI